MRASSFSPASVTCVLYRSSAVSFLSACEFLQSRVRHLRAAQVKRGEVLERCEFLQSRVRHLRAVQVERGEFLEGASSFSPASVTCVPCRLR